MISCKTEECHLARNDITNFYHQDTLYLSLIAVCDFFDTHAIAYSCISCPLKKFFDLGKGGHMERQGRKYSPDR